MVKYWTEEETKRGRELVDRGISKDEFFQIMGRTKAAFFSHVQIKRCRDRPERASQSGVIVNKVVIPDDVYLDARRRQSAPRSLTSLIFGDPSPGWSALDRKREHGGI